LREPWRTGEYAKFASAIREAEERHRIPRDLLARLFNYEPAVIKGTNRNPLGALGIAQLTYDVAAPLDPFRDVRDGRLEPQAAIELGARHLSNLHFTFGSWRRAVLAYRWHPDFVKKLLHHEPGRVVPEVPTLIAADIERICADVHVPA
jgi:hypothetical protein